MQVLWNQRKVGGDEWTLMTGVMFDDPVSKVTQAILARRFNVPTAVSSRHTDDEYVAFPSAEAEYCDLCSLVRYTSTAAAEEAKQEFREQLGDMASELAALKERLAAKDEELKKKKTPAPKPAPAGSNSIPLDSLDVALERFGEKLGAILSTHLGKQAPDSEDEAKGRFDPTEVRTWAQLIGAQVEDVDAAMDRLETKLRFHFSIFEDRASLEMRNAFKALMCWARNACYIEDWESTDQVEQGTLLLQTLRLEVAAAKGINKRALQASVEAKVRKERRDLFGVAEAELARTTQGRQGRNRQMICYNCRKPGHTRPNCPERRKDDRANRSNMGGGRQPQL